MAESEWSLKIRAAEAKFDRWCQMGVMEAVMGTAQGEVDEKT